MTTEKLAERHGVAIIGAGVGGLAFGIALKRQLNCEEFMIYEKASDVGGTWRDNTYPGCASDVPIHYYSLSTDLNPYWKKSHGSRSEIKDYWAGLSTKYNLYPHIAFNTRVVSANWDAAAQEYEIVLEETRPEVTYLRSVRAKVLVSALGLLEIPKYPTGMQGTDTFNGKVFHSARWDHTVDLSGKRVAVVGNGCSCSQFLPIISQDPTVQVVNFCRTPNWLADRPHTPYSDLQRWIFAHVPGAMRLHRNFIFFSGDILYTFFQSETASNWLRKYFKSYMLKAAPKEYHDKIIPNFAPGCKRTIIDTNYLTALGRPNVSVNWDGIEAVVEDGIVTKKGETIPFDVIILATGYTTDTYPLPVKGVDGVSVQDYYASKGGPTAYLGTTLPGFPNFYILGGPNTVTGHSSVIFTEEVQINYSLTMIAPVLEGLVSSFEVTPRATDAYNEKIQSRLQGTVYTQCVSWYRKDGTGKITSPFPGPVSLFWWYLRSPIWRDYKAVGAERWARMRMIVKATKLLGLLGLALGVAYVARNPKPAGEMLQVSRNLVSAIIDKAQRSIVH